jgi:hypothetical protein
VHVHLPMAGGANIHLLDRVKKSARDLCAGQNLSMIVPHCIAWASLCIAHDCFALPAPSMSEEQRP